MPNKPEKKRKAYHAPERKQHARTKNMQWFYNSRRWRKFSKLFRDQNPFCLHCKQQGIVTPATVTDHIDVYEVNPAGFDLDNLKAEHMQPLCDKCHAIKSGKESKRSRIIRGYGVKSTKG